MGWLVKRFIYGCTKCIIKRKIKILLIIFILKKWILQKKFILNHIVHPDILVYIIIKIQLNFMKNKKIENIYNGMLLIKKLKLMKMEKYIMNLILIQLKIKQKIIDQLITFNSLPIFSKAFTHSSIFYSVWHDDIYTLILARSFPTTG